MQLEHDLKEERLARKLDEREVHYLRVLIKETQACHKNINVMKNFKIQLLAGRAIKAFSFQ